MTAERDAGSRRGGQRFGRRAALRLLGGGAFGVATSVLVGCSGEDDPPLLAGGAPPSLLPTQTAVAPDAPRPPTPKPSPTPEPRVVFPAGLEDVALLPSTDWTTPLYAKHSGREGLHVLVLGGVHGNEPGGWAAATEVVNWRVAAGSLLVAPRANLRATIAFQRTLPELGDLNRLYPGSERHILPMSRMAHAIVQTVREYRIDLVLDLHESWGFFNERTQNGTAFLGQTLTRGTGPYDLFDLARVIEAVNRDLTHRERLVMRDRSVRRLPDGTLPTPTPTPELPDGARLTAPEEADPFGQGRSRSSLGIGLAVEGATAVLIEMGQQDQPESRRSEIHQRIVRQFLTHHGMV